MEKLNYSKVIFEVDCDNIARSLNEKRSCKFTGLIKELYCKSELNLKIGIFGFVSLYPDLVIM